MSLAQQRQTDELTNSHSNERYLARHGESESKERDILPCGHGW